MQNKKCYSDLIEYFYCRYMKGRETLDDIQHFLETVIIRCFTSKYTLLPKKREALAPMEMDLWSLYKSQEEYFKGKLNSITARIKLLVMQ